MPELRQAEPPNQPRYQAPSGISREKALRKAVLSAARRGTTPTTRNPPTHRGPPPTSRPHRPSRTPPPSLESRLRRLEREREGGKREPFRAGGYGSSKARSHWEPPEEHRRRGGRYSEDESDDMRKKRSGRSTARCSPRRPSGSPARSRKGHHPRESSKSRSKQRSGSKDHRHSPSRGGRKNRHSDSDDRASSRSGRSGRAGRSTRQARYMSATRSSSLKRGNLTPSDSSQTPPTSPSVDSRSGGQAHYSPHSSSHKHRTNQRDRDHRGGRDRDRSTEKEALEVLQASANLKSELERHMTVTSELHRLLEVEYRRLFKENSSLRGNNRQVLDRGILQEVINAALRGDSSSSPRFPPTIAALLPSSPAHSTRLRSPERPSPERRSHLPTHLPDPRDDGPTRLTRGYFSSIHPQNGDDTIGTTSDAENGRDLFGSGRLTHTPRDNRPPPGPIRTPPPTNPANHYPPHPNHNHNHSSESPFASQVRSKSPKRPDTRLHAQPPAPTSFPPASSLPAPRCEDPGGQSATVQYNPYTPTTASPSTNSTYHRTPQMQLSSASIHTESLQPSSSKFPTAPPPPPRL